METDETCVARIARNPCEWWANTGYQIRADFPPMDMFQPYEGCEIEGSPVHWSDPSPTVYTVVIDHDAFGPIGSHRKWILPASCID